MKRKGHGALCAMPYAPGAMRFHTPDLNLTMNQIFNHEEEE